MIEMNNKWSTSAKPLIWGLLFSIALLALSYYCTFIGLSKGAFMITVWMLAIGQAIIQFIYFMHLFVETKPRWNLIIFLFMLVIIVVLVGGSIWIMDNLSYNIMPRFE